MSSLLEFDLGEILEEELRRQRRPEDGLLHASSHITAPLRHVQLDLAGAPKQDNELIALVRMYTGTMWHEFMANTVRRLGVPAMAEVNLTPFMPAGWGGTADLVVWNPSLKAFVLVDLKTTKGEGIPYILRDGAKKEHVAQTSAYWHALKKMGLPLAKAVGVLYLPMNDTRKGDLIEPVLIDFDPLPAKDLLAEMKSRRKRADAYVASLPKPNPRPLELEEYVTDELEPESAREQRIYFDRATGSYDLKLVPVWQTMFCPYDEELCSCRNQGTTKIGTFDTNGVDYYPRTGFESIAPTVFPKVRSES